MDKISTKPSINDGSSTVVLNDNECSFKIKDSTHYDLLVLPFKNINEENYRQDIGFVISQRLDSLNKADSLNLNIKFCKTFYESSRDSNFL